MAKTITQPTQPTEAQRLAKALAIGHVYEVRNAVTGAFLLTAPLTSLAQIFSLQEPALMRIVREAGVTTECTLHFNGKFYLGAPSVKVGIR